jgi:hypothetical protein
MPFGLASAPLIFQSIVYVFVAPLHTLGLKLHFYLDDWLLRNASKDILKSQMNLLIKNVRLAGWIMNEEKSELSPSQDFIFIGIHFCTRVGLMFPPPDRIVKILSRVRQLSALKFCQAREFLSLLGLLNSVADQIPHGRLHIGKFPFQNPYYEMFGNFGNQKLISSGKCCYSHATPHPKLSMFTDTSNFGWGACVNEVNLTTKGTWSQEESKMSINILELKAVLLCVKHFLNRLKNRRVSLFSDNSTVVAYI